MTAMKTALEWANKNHHISAQLVAEIQTDALAFVVRRCRGEADFFRHLGDQTTPLALERFAELVELNKPIR